MFGTFPSFADILVKLPGVVMAIAFHEYAHAQVAAWFGDPTPRLQGRVTISPRSHIDILGLLLFLFLGFGWGRPVQTNPTKFHNRFWGEIAVALAGVTVNFILAVLFGILAAMAEAGMFGVKNVMLEKTLGFAQLLNVILVAFNIIPLPPLDGWHVLRRLLPVGLRDLSVHVERWGFLILAMLFFLPIGRNFFMPLFESIWHASQWVVGFVVRPLVGA